MNEQEKTRIKNLISNYLENPIVEHEYSITPDVSVVYRSFTAYEHRWFLGWLAVSLPKDIKSSIRHDYEMGLRNLCLYIRKFGDEGIGRNNVHDSFPNFCERTKTNEDIDVFRKAAYDVFDTKLAAISTKSDVATAFLSTKATDFFNNFVHVEYDSEENKHFDEITLETILFDYDRLIPAKIADGVINIEFNMLSNKTVSLVERWVDSEKYDNKAEYDYIRSMKYLSASIVRMNGKNLSGDPHDFGNKRDEVFQLNLFDRRLQFLYALPHSIIMLLDSCRAHLARCLQNLVLNIDGGLKN